MSEELQERPPDADLINSLKELMSTENDPGDEIHPTPSFIPDTVASIDPVASSELVNESSSVVASISAAATATADVAVKTEDVESSLLLKPPPDGTHRVFFPPIELHVNLPLYLDLLRGHADRFVAAAAVEGDNDEEQQQQLVQHVVDALHRTKCLFMDKGQVLSSKWVWVEADVASTVIANVFRSVAEFDSLMTRLDDAQDAYDESNLKLMEALSRHNHEKTVVVGDRSGGDDDDVNVPYSDNILDDARENFERRKQELEGVERHVEELEDNLGAIISLLKSKQFVLGANIGAATTPTKKRKLIQ